MMPLVLCQSEFILSTCCLDAVMRYERVARRSCACISTDIRATHPTLELELSLSLALARCQRSAMVESPSASTSSSIWQALRIMLQLPDLLGEFLSALPFGIEWRLCLSFAFALASVSVCILLSTVSTSSQLCAASGPVGSRWATTSSLPLSTTISGHTGMHWLVASWRYCWPWVGPCSSVTSSAIASIISI